MALNVVGLFERHEAAEAAVRDLVANGIDRGRISAVASESEAKLLSEQVRHDGGYVGEAAGIGLTSGAVVGGLLGLLIGAGLFLAPVGIVAAGPLAGLLAGSAAGAATGTFVGALVGLGIPERDADLYSAGIERGGTLLIVAAEDAEVDRVHQILDRDGAIDIEDRGFLYPADAAAVDAREGHPLPDPAASIPTRIRVYHHPVPSQSAGSGAANSTSSSGDHTDVADTMGGMRPRYGSLDDNENRQAAP